MNGVTPARAPGPSEASVQLDADQVLYLVRVRKLTNEAFLARRALCIMRRIVISTFTLTQRVAEPAGCGFSRFLMSFYDFIIFIHRTVFTIIDSPVQ